MPWKPSLIHRAKKDLKFMNEYIQSVYCFPATRERYQNFHDRLKRAIIIASNTKCDDPLVDHYRDCTHELYGAIYNDTDCKIEMQKTLKAIQNNSLGIRGSFNKKRAYNDLLKQMSNLKEKAKNSNEALQAKDAQMNNLYLKLADKNIKIESLTKEKQDLIHRNHMLNEENIDLKAQNKILKNHTKEVEKVGKKMQLMLDRTNTVLSLLNEKCAFEPQLKAAIDDMVCEKIPTLPQTIRAHIPVNSSDCKYKTKHFHLQHLVA